MKPKVRTAFLLLVFAQVAHSIEEYVFALYEVFAPARAVSGLFSRDLERGFIVANVSLIAFGLWCYLARVRTGHRSARALAWGWTVLEIGNGIGHVVLVLWRGAYVPGVATAPLLIGIAALLARELSHTSRSLPSAGDGATSRRGRAAPRHPEFR